MNIRILPDSKPKNFNFIFKYGIGAKNQLDTDKGQFTKDMVADPSITTNLKLTNEELNTIYLEMKKINILDYPEDFKPESKIMQEPYDTYFIKIIVNGTEKNIEWKDMGVSKTAEAIQLRQLFNMIVGMIISKEEFKKLPNPTSGYL